MPYFASDRSSRLYIKMRSGEPTVDTMIFKPCISISRSSFISTYFSRLRTKIDQFSSSTH